MRTLRSLWTAVVALAIGTALAGCASSRCLGEVMPTDLPENPEPCTKYCRVWVPPVYRKVPKLCQEPPCTVEVPEVVERVRFAEVCTKPSQVKACRTPDTLCEVAAVQMTRGGWQWKRDEQCCWKYVYVPPCYRWCTKTVGEEGIEYCAETPAEWKTVAWTERKVCMRRERTAPRFTTKWCDEVYTPGHWEWKATKLCDGCVECGPCPPAPCPRPEPCPPPCPSHALADGCDRSN